MNIKKGFVFIVDTNEYSGNFERELTAYVTGVVGECEVGDEYIDDKITPIFQESIQQCSDDNGCYRPCEAINSPDGRCNSVGIFFHTEPTPEQISIMKDRSYDFNQVRIDTDSYYKNSDIKILGFRLIEVAQQIKIIEL